MGTEKEITNTSTGVTPEDLGGSGPSTDLNTKDFPPGTTSVDNGVPSNIDTLHRLGKVAKAPAEEDPYAEFGGSITKPQPQPQAAAAAPAKEEDPYAEFGGSITHQTEEEKRAALQTKPLYAGTRITGISSNAPVDDRLPIDKKLGLPGPAEYKQWVKDLQADVQNGTGATAIGRLLQWMGARGTRTGQGDISNPGGGGPWGHVGAIIGGPLEGPTVMAQAPADLHEGHYLRAVNHLVSGAFQTAGPFALLNPTAIPVVMQASLAGTVAANVSSELGADEDTQEFVNLGTAVVVGGGIHNKSEAADRFGRIATNHISATNTLEARVREFSNAESQAVEAQNKAAEAHQKWQNGEVTQIEVDQARNAASEAQANLTKSRKAVTDAAAHAYDTRLDLESETNRLQKKAKAKPAIDAEKQQAAIEDFSKAIPPTKGAKGAYTAEDMARANPYMVEGHAAEKAENIEGVRNMLQNQVDGVDDQLRPTILKYGDNPIKVEGMNGDPASLTQVVLENIQKSGETFPEGFVNDVAQELQKYDLDNMTLKDADALRQHLIKENRATMSQNSWNVTDAYAKDPKFAARSELYDALREGIHGALNDLGVKGSENLRLDQAALIRIKNAADAAIRQGEVVKKGTSEVGPVRKVAGKAAGYAVKAAGGGVGALAGEAVGLPVEGAVAGTLAATPLAGKIEAAIAPPDVTRNQLAVRGLDRLQQTHPKPLLDLTGAQEPATAPPVHPLDNSPLHAELTSMYPDATPGEDSYKQLEARFMRDYERKIQMGLRKELTTEEKGIHDQIIQNRYAELKAAQDAADKAVEAAKKAAAAEKAAAEKAAAEKAATVATNETKAEGEEGEEGTLLTAEKGEKQTPLAHQYQATITTPEGDQTVTVEGHSFKTALENARKQFPEATAISIDQRLERTPVQDYQVPNKKILSMQKSGTKSPVQTIIHELGHYFLGHKEGMNVFGGMYRHTHPDMPSGVRAGIRWTLQDLIDPTTGKIATEKLPGLIRNIMGGVAADEAFNNIPRGENHNMDWSRGGSDGNMAANFLKQAGLTEDEANAYIHKAVDEGVAHLTNPAVSSVLLENAGVREPGLSSQYHMSDERLRSMGNEATRRMRNAEAGTAGTTGVHNTGVGEAGGGARGANAARGEGEPAPKPVEGTEEKVTTPEKTEKYHPALQAIADKVGTSTDPGGIVGGASWIAPDGKFIHMQGGVQHPDSIEFYAPGYRQTASHAEGGDIRVPFINDTGAVRTRYQTGTRAGDRLAISVPKDGVTPDQVESIRQAVGQAARNKASVDMEVAARDGKFVKNENPRVSDTEDMLRELGVHPEGKLQTAEVTEKSPSKRQVEAHEANGGSTFTPAGEDLAGKNLYAVGAHPDRTVQVDKLTPRVLDKFKADNADLLADGKHSIGTWKDPETGKSVLDVSQLHNDREGAIAAGKAANQKSIYHLGGEGEIQTGGTGEGKYSTATHPHLPQDMIDDMQPDELEALRDKPAQQKSVVKEYNKIAPSIDEIANAAKAGKALGGWWQRFMDTFKAMGEPDEAADIKQLGPAHTEALKAFHGALSGNKAVEHANKLAWNAYRDWLDMGRPKDRASINQIIAQNGKAKGVAAISDTMRGNKILHEGLDTTKLYKLVNSPQMRDVNPVPFTGNAFLDSPVEGVSSGAKKIPSMVATTAGEGNLNRVVFDTHMKDIYGQLGLTDAKYIADSLHIRRAAKELGLAPGEAQEQIWGTVLALKSLLGEGLSPEEVSAQFGDQHVGAVTKDYAQIILNQLESDPDFRATLDGLSKHGFNPTSPKAIARLKEIVAEGQSRFGTTNPADINRELLAKSAERLGAGMKGYNAAEARQATRFDFGANEAPEGQAALPQNALDKLAGKK